MDKYLTSSLPKVLPQNLTSCFFWFYVRFDYECDFFFRYIFCFDLGVVEFEIVDTKKRGGTHNKETENKIGNGVPHIWWRTSMMN
jgi:hypothetical protein